MAGIDDYIGQATASVDEFAMDKLDRMKISNKSSNINMASKLAVLSDAPEGIESVYRSISSDLDSGMATEQLTEMIKSRSYEESKKVMLDVLASPDFSDEQKQAAAGAVLDLNNEMYSVDSILAAESLGAENSNEPPEAEYVRVSMAEAIGELNQFKEDAQALLNHEASKTNPNAIMAFADVFEYMIPFIESKFAGSVLSDMRGGDRSAYLKAFTMLGNSKKEIRDMLYEMPVQDRMGMIQAIIGIVNESDSITLFNENDFAKIDMLRTVLEDGYYENGDRLIDNMVSILDASILGKPAMRGLRAIAGATKDAGLAARDAARAAVRSRVQPKSVSQVYKDTNPSKAKAAHQAAAADDTGEAAQALYGASRVDAVAGDLAPEVESLAGGVKAKVSSPDAPIPGPDIGDQRIIEFAFRSGHTEFSEFEKAQMRARAVNDFEQVEGARPRREMFQYNNTDSGVSIKGMYGPTKSGYSDPEQALSMMERAYKDYGLTRDNMTLMVRQGDEYVPTTLEEVQAMASKARRQKKRLPDYLVQMEYNYKFDPGDIDEWSRVDVKYNIFDRIGVFLGTPNKGGTATSGSLQQHALDPASMFGPLVMTAANRSVDKAAALEKALLRKAGEVGDSIQALPKDRQGLVLQAMREQNANKRVYSYSELVAKGYTPAEMETLAKWKSYWDTNYVLENRDMARTLNQRGYKEFINTSDDTKLIAKPVHKNHAGSHARVFDPSTGTIENLTKAQIDELYESGGTLARLRQPTRVGDEAAELIVSPESAGKAYLKDIGDNTTVLNYIEGYYPVKYKDPLFIDEIVRDSRGNELYRVARATAGDTKDAQAMRDRMVANKGDSLNEFVVRKDKKGQDVGTDTHWDVEHSKGRIAQRVRGERLEASTSTLDDLSQAPIEGPVDTMIHAARSISQRVSMRDWLETNKLRFEANWGDLLPTGKFGQKMWPNKVTDIKYQGVGDESASAIADARTMWGYINYMENGFANALDDTYKAALKGMADIFGNAGASRAERAANWLSNQRGPSSLAKGTVFTAYLAANPVRQFIVQGHQAMQLLANYPKWFASGRVTSELFLLSAGSLDAVRDPRVLKQLGFNADEATEMLRRWDESGLSAAIDKSNLVRDSLVDLADNVSAINKSGPVKAFTGTLGLARKLGFDAGENANMMTAWLAHRDAAIRAGKDMSLESTWDEIGAAARNYTYNMTKSGDLPYNQNALQVVFQFMQVPHKAMTTMLFNRQLTPMQRTRLLGFNALMYSLPPATMYHLFGGILPEDEESRDLVVQGLEGYMLNKFLSMAADDKVDIDFSGLSPLDVHGMAGFVHGLITTDVGTLVAESPAGQLFFGHNPKLTNFAKSVARFTNFTMQGIDSPVEFSDVVRDGADIFSGFSNAFKAKYAWEYGHKLNTVGGLSDANVNGPEAIAAAFGFRTMDEVRMQAIKEQSYKAYKGMNEDVEKLYREVKRMLAKDGLTSREFDYRSKVLSTAWMVFGNDNYKAKEMLNDLITKDMWQGDHSMSLKLMNMHGIMGSKELKGMIDNLPDYDPQMKADMKAAIDAIDKLQAE